MFRLHRFRIKRRRIAAIALLPVAALTATNGISIATAVVGDPTALRAAATGVELKAGKHHTRAGSKVPLSGVVAPGGERSVVIRVNGRAVDKVKTGPQGRFKARWRPSSPGVYKVAAIVPAADGGAAVRSKGEHVNAYRAVEASYYGPGLYGGGMACGGTLTPSTVGVANKTLPCGSKVTLRHGSKTVTVPVVDRGPYSGNREYDLTAATKQKLGFGSTGTVLSTK